MQTNVKKIDASSAKPNGISAEFKHFLSDIEDLVAQATSLTGEDLNKAKRTLSTRIDAAKHSLENVGGTIAEKARTSAAATDAYVHQQPWAAIGAGAAIGLLVGFLVSRRD
jgi:ElaB/YqjD/DUF883 family membrane-anchored ribosome-binding protein